MNNTMSATKMSLLTLLSGSFLTMIFFFQGVELSSDTVSSPASGGFNSPHISPAGTTVQERFRVPGNHRRRAAKQGSFAYYLRHLPLKPHGALVLYHDGMVKQNRNIYSAVVDIEIGHKDLVQCADAVMLLRGEYLFRQGEYDRIHFNFVRDGKPRHYRNWGGPRDSHENFRRYMDHVFTYANTRSLAGELAMADFRNMEIGHVFIQTGNPYGHAVIIVDLAVDERSGRKVFLLAQSYMPAQEIQVLENPGDREMSPWYRSDFEGFLETPEWVFLKGDLRRFRD